MASSKGQAIFACTLLCLISMVSGAVAAGSKTDARIDFLNKALASLPADAGAKTLAPYFFVRSADEQTADLLPLKSVQSQVDIAGVIAGVSLVQTYENEGSETLEAIYIFPASTRAAVHAMRMTIGERVIQARIAKSEEASKDYKAAKEKGQTASLLEQKRPNVFSMSVANIQPGDRIEVELKYTELLVPEGGQYEFVLPTVVGPRYSNSPVAEAAADERWVENPYLKAGEEPPYSFRLGLNLTAGLPIAKISSPSHHLEVQYKDENSASVQLDGAYSGNRDFVLRYRLAGDKIEHGLLLYEGPQEKFFLLMMQPPAQVERSDTLAREYIFVLDVSGSMGGFPLDTSKELMRKLLKDLRSFDSFNILLFAGGNKVLSSKSLPATRANVRRALDWMEVLDGGGGTELLPALERALSMPQNDRVSRTLVVLTDGYVSVDRKAFELIRKKRGEANLFAFGIGSSVNRNLIEGMARAGLGEPYVVLKPTEAAAQAEKFRRYVSAPVMRGIQVSFDEFDAYDVEPLAVPDLFAERPLIVFGKWRGKAKGRIAINGISASGPLDGLLDVSKFESMPKHASIQHLWARHRIRELDDLATFGDDESIAAEITRLGLKYSLLTHHTSFLAVDTRKRGHGKKVQTLKQPLPMPQGVPNSAVGGRMAQVGVLGVLGTSGSGHGANGLGLFGSGSGYGGTAVRGRSQLQMASPMVTGSVSKSSIQQVVRKNTKRVRALYERQLKANPNLSGKIVVKIVVGPNGKVAKVEITEDTLKDPIFAAGLIKLIKRWRFPKQPGGGQLVVNYPFIFRFTP